MNCLAVCLLACVDAQANLFATAPDCVLNESPFLLALGSNEGDGGLVFAAGLTQFEEPWPAPDAPPDIDVPGEFLSAPPEAELGPLGSGAGPLSFRADLQQFPGTIRDDLNRVFQPRPIVWLLAAGGASWAIRESLDQQVADDARRSPNRWGVATETLTVLGSPSMGFASSASLYLLSLRLEDPYFHDFSQTLGHTLIVGNGLCFILKGAVDADRPNGRSYGWPSGHAETSMAVAVVVHRYYGWKAGIPMYALAGAVSYSRIDSEQHYLSDVVFGMALGFVVGHVIADGHLDRIGGGTLNLFADVETGAQGLAWQRRY